MIGSLFPFPTRNWWLYGVSRGTATSYLSTCIYHVRIGSSGINTSSLTLLLSSSSSSSLHRPHPLCFIPNNCCSGCISYVPCYFSAGSLDPFCILFLRAVLGTLFQYYYDYYFSSLLYCIEVAVLRAFHPWVSSRNHQSSYQLKCSNLSPSGLWPLASSHLSYPSLFHLSRKTKTLLILSQQAMDISGCEGPLSLTRTLPITNFSSFSKTYTVQI